MIRTAFYRKVIAAFGGEAAFAVAAVAWHHS